MRKRFVSIWLSSTPTPRLLKRIAEWCIRFTPSAAIDLPDGIILDATGCSHLWGGDEAYIKNIIQQLQAKGCEAKASIADTIGCAWAITRFGNSLVIEASQQNEALLPLPPQALRIDPEITERLHKLGLRQIKNFISIPRPALRRRFGKQLIQRINQALGTEEEFIEPVCPIKPYQERLPCMEPITHTAGIETALQTLLEQLCARLKKESKGLRSAQFKGYRTDSKVVTISIGTNRPSNNVKHLFHLFEMKLSTFAPGMGIELFTMEASTVEDHTPAQEEFWKQNGGLNDPRLSELLDRLSIRTGETAINRYLPDEHYWPERSFKKATSITEPPTTTWQLDKPRPLNLLEKPERIEVAAPIPDYPPINFRHKGKLHTVIKSDGPERIEQEWWIEEGRHRDYYAVEDENGCRYWVFRSGHYDAENKGQWFLHGFFA